MLNLLLFWFSFCTSYVIILCAFACADTAYQAHVPTTASSFAQGSIKLQKIRQPSNLIIIVFIAIVIVIVIIIIISPRIGAANKSKSKHTKKERTTKQKQNYTNSREKIKEKKKSKSASCRDKAASCGHSFSCFSVRVKGKATENYYTKKGKVHGEK